MRAIAEIQVIPIGSGVSVRKEVKRAHGILADSGLEVGLHANGTNVGGELHRILEVIEEMLETLSRSAPERTRNRRWPESCSR
jgi:uncharacterized protein YqgV (UPF0045/DUF77 family)